jgi:UDP-N-acetylglucosamine acyltransferase
MHKLLYRTGKTLAQAILEITEISKNSQEATQDMAMMLQFLNASTRGIAR